MIIVTQISWQDTLPIRNSVLRPNQPISSCQFFGDESPENFHLGVFEDKKLAGILSVFKNSNLNFSDENQYQLRGMAVLPEFRNQKLGLKLLTEAEKKVTENGATILWCNARITAENFYKKQQYQSFGDYFDIPNIGLHVVMHKQLN